MIPKKPAPAKAGGWTPVSRLHEALARLISSLDASAGEGRPEKIMLPL